MIKAIYAGSFDPVTLGHLDIIKRAAEITDHLVVAILENPNKKALFTVEERKHHLELVTKEIGATVAIRGLRNSIDFAAEFQMYLINRKLYGAIETIFLAADEEHLALSSTNVKEVAVFGGNIDFMVPKEIREFVAEKYKK